MRKVSTIFVFSILAVSLSGCSMLSSIPSTLSGAIHDLTASGAKLLSGATKTVHDTIELGKMGIKKTTDTVDDVKKRADKAGEGVGKMKEGIDMIKDATK